MKLSVSSLGLAKHEEICKRHIACRIKADFAAEGLKIHLRIDPALGDAESYCIREEDGGFDVVGADERGLLYGIGKLLHSARWTEEAFFPRATEGVVTPASEFRAIYFSIHFYNWYQNAPTEELERYLEELVLWGYNTVVCVCPVVNVDTLEDPLFFECAEKARRVYRLANKLGLKKGFIVGPNQGTKTAPHDWDADPSYDPDGVRGAAGRNLCPAKPGVQEYMNTIYEGQLGQFAREGLDYVIAWPYDEGGCGCEKCRPWGANGFLEACKQIRQVAKRLHPHSQFILSTWLFDSPPSGEYEGLYRRLTEDMSFVDLLMTDAHSDFPRYPLEHPPVKPVVNFPEISMWKLYPWGGFGANPMPERFQRFWDSAKAILRGGMPYSEGLYEDISKVQCVGYYWHPDRHWREILGEYAAYEFDESVAEAVPELLTCIESNHVATGEKREPSLALALRAGELARQIDAALSSRAKKSWRWRILYIRAILDEKRHRYYFDHHMQGEDDLWILYHFSGVFLARDKEAQELLSELQSIYHSSPLNGENQYTLPPVKGSTVL